MCIILIRVRCCTVHNVAFVPLLRVEVGVVYLGPTLYMEVLNDDSPVLSSAIFSLFARRMCLILRHLNQ